MSVTTRPVPGGILAEEVCRHTAALFERESSLAHARLLSLSCSRLIENNQPDYRS